MTVGWGIVGIGRHADGRMAPAIRIAPSATLIGVASRDQGRADAFAEKHGGKGYDNFDEMLANPDIEWVYVGSPNGLHAEQSIACMEAGKNVLVDKPIAISVAEAEAMIRTSRRTGKLLVPGFNVRYQPVHAEARRILASGTVGNILTARTEAGTRPRYVMPGWRHERGVSGGGAIYNIGPHATEMLRYITGLEVEEVRAVASFDENGIDNTTIASMAMTGGVQAMLVASRELPYPTNGVAVYTDQGRVETIHSLSYDIEGELVTTTRQGVRRDKFTAPTPGYDVFVGEIEHLSRISREGGEPRASAHDGLMDMRILIALEESAKSGLAVQVDSTPVS